MTPIYTPIVKGKVNDIKALGKMPKSLAAETVPLLELLAPNVGQSFERSYVNFGSHLQKHCPYLTVAVDLHSIAPDQKVDDGSPALEALCKYMRGLGVQFLPVFGFDHEPELWPRIAKIAKKENRGVTFRLKMEDIEAGDDTVAMLIEHIEDQGLRSSQTNLVVDLASLHARSEQEIVKVRELTQEFIEMAMTARDFGQISVVGSSIPKDVSEVPKNGTMLFARRELPLWLEIRASVPRAEVIFGDYGVVHPNFSDKSLATNANGKIRYTSRLHHQIFRGHSLRQGVKFGQYREISERVLASKSYGGRDFSFGDEYIWRCANHEAGTGHLGTWVEVDMNHHLVFTAAQLRRVLASIRKGISVTDTLAVAG